MPINISVDTSIKKDASSAIRNGVKKYMEDGAQAGFNFAFEVMPEDRGTLRASMFEPEWDNNGNLRYGARANHAAAMEFGTKPFWPPISPLIEWAERVSGDKSLGFYVQWKIAQEGIRAQPYLRPGARKQEQWYKARDVRNYIEDNL